MTSPFGMPTFVKVGKKKTPKQLGAPGSVRPPTQSGQATITSILKDSEQSTGAGQDLTVSLPSIASGDLIMLAVANGDADVTTPTGYTLLVSADNDGGTPPHGRFEIFYRVADGTEGATLTVSQGGSDLGAAWLVWVIRGDVDWATNPPEATTNTAGTNNPPSISPTTAPAEHLVFALYAYTKKLESPPSGYTVMVDVDYELGVNQQNIYGAYKLVDVTTSEDPGAWTIQDPPGTAGGIATEVTVAVLAESAADVATGDHTHTEDEVTDHTKLTQKASPVAADKLLVYDSEDSHSKKYSEIDDLPGLLPTGTTKGDVAVYNGTAWVRVGVGANDTVFTADSAESAGVKWAAGGGGGGGSLSTLGSTVPGTVTFVTPTSTAKYSRKFTMSSAGTILSVGIYVKQTVANVWGQMRCALYTDDSGQPGEMIAVNDGSAITSSLLLNTTAANPRWIHMPLSAILTATDYWASVWIADTTDITIGTDATTGAGTGISGRHASGGAWWSEKGASGHSWTATADQEQLIRVQALT